MTENGMESYCKLENEGENTTPTWRQMKGNKLIAENHIDYIYGRKKFFRKGKFHLDEDWDIYPSDHLPLFVELDDGIFL